MAQGNASSRAENQALLADPLVLVIAIVPVLAVSALRVAPGLLSRLQNGSGHHHPRPALAGYGREASLAVAAAAAYLVAWWAGRLLRAAGGYTQPPDPFARLAAFLRQHDLASGIGGYWDASAITVDTGGAVTVRAVTQGCLQPYAWESKPAWYDPAARTASFVLESSGTGYFGQWRAAPAALRRLGPLLPAAGHALLRPGDGYTVRAYRGNLLAQLPRLAGC